MIIEITFNGKVLLSDFHLLGERHIAFKIAHVHHEHFVIFGLLAGSLYEAAFEFGSTDFVHDERRRVGSVGRHLSRVDVPAFVSLAFEDDVELSG